MIKPIIRFYENEKEPMYNITLRKVGKYYEGWGGNDVWVENCLVSKNPNKRKLLKELDKWCKELYLENKKLGMKKKKKNNLQKSGEVGNGDTNNS